MSSRSKRVDDKCIQAIENIMKELNPGHKELFGREVSFTEASFVLGYRYLNPTMVEKASKIPIGTALKLLDNRRR